MNLPFYLGVFGSIILVVGAAWPPRTVKHPVRSAKNWLFAIGGMVMLAYSILNYLDGGSVFFIFLQGLVNISSVLMMLDVPDHVDTPIIIVAGLALIGWSFMLFEGTDTIFFIIGLSGIGMGYALENGTFKRNAALTLGSALIALFSYIEANYVFFWLNVFFALFSGYYAYVLFRKKR